MHSLHIGAVPVALLLMISVAACSTVLPSEVTAQGEISAQETRDNETLAQEVADFDPNNFDNPTTIDNEWWPLQPGTRLVYEGVQVEDGEEIPHRVVDTITDLTKVINGVRTLISLEEDYSDDQLIEKEIVSRPG